VTLLRSVGRKERAPTGGSGQDLAVVRFLERIVPHPKATFVG
jgi:hypothetical protein